MRLITVFLLLSFSSLLYAQYPHYDPLFYDHVHNSNELVFSVDSAYAMRPSGNYWKINKIFKLTERNEFGKMIGGDGYQLNDFDEFELNKKWSASYVENGNLNFFNKELWNPDTNNWVLKERQICDEEGLLLDYKYKWWNFEIPESCTGWGDSYQYDINKNKTVEKTLSWHLLGGWRNLEQFLDSYDSNNYITEHIYQKWDAELSKWYNVTKWDYFYDGDLNTYCFIYTWNTQDSIWGKLWKRTHEYDYNNYLTEVKYLRPITDSTYQNNSKWEYDRNNMGKEVEKREYRFDTLNSNWKHNYTYNWEYLFDSIMCMSSYIKWREDTGIWINIFRRTWEYTDDLQISYFLEERGPWDEWNNNEQQIFEYYDNYLISYERQNWIHGVNKDFWRPEYREEYYWPNGVGVLNNVFANDKAIVYTNPTKNYISIKTENTEIPIISIYDITGKKIENYQSGQFQELINISELKNGIYLLKLEFPSETIIKKIIKN